MRRKKYIVDSRFQLLFVSRVVMLILITLMLAGIFSYMVSFQLSGQSSIQLFKVVNQYVDEPVVVEKFTIVGPVVIKALLAGGVAGIIIAVISMISYSHRLAGPLFRIERKLKALVSGDISGEELKLREKDEFQAVAELVNKLQERLKKRY